MYRTGIAAHTSIHAAGTALMMVALLLMSGQELGAQAQAEGVNKSPLRRPAVSARHTLAFEQGGQIFLRSGDGSTIRASTGSAYHRDAAFGKDALYFASDSAGNYDIWRLALDGNERPSGAATRITSSPLHDVAPGVNSEGVLVFQRGLGGDARIWVRNADGSEHRLSKAERMELRPRFSPDGRRVAFMVSTETSRKVVTMPLTGGNEATVMTDNGIEDIAWGGAQIAVSTRNGVFVVPASGGAGAGGPGGGFGGGGAQGGFGGFAAQGGGAGAGYQNLVSRSHGDVDWSQDGALITIVQPQDVSVSYNGDPDRGVDRSAHELQRLGSGVSLPNLYQLAAPAEIDASRKTIAAAGTADRSADNAAAFDRVWERSANLYFSDTIAHPSVAAKRAAWNSVRQKLRPAAIAATSDSALQRVIFEALRQRPPLRDEATGRAAVSSANPVATEAGLEIFRAGGNVIDATVAVSFALGVVEPDASGIGGYGEMVISLNNQPKPTMIEFMSRVPEKGGLDNTSLLVNGRYPSDGPVLVNVPGTVAGMYLAWQRYGSGKLPWSALLAPAIRAAHNGYAVSDGLATTLATEREHFAKYPGSTALFFRDGKPMTVGDTVKNPDLAWVLEQIAEKGADGFYKGEVAERWVKDLSSHGNAMQTSDMAMYFANERDPVCGSYRVYRVCSSAPPVSGGADLVARLNLLEHFPNPKRYNEDAPTLHAALSAWFLTPSSRGKISDPALWPVDVTTIVDKDTSNVRWGCYDPNAALTPASVRGDVLACLSAKAARSGAGTDAADATYPAGTSNTWTAAIPDRHNGDKAASMDSPCGDDHAAEVSVCHSSGTTAFTVADAQGNVVAVTQTLGTWGGNFYVTPGLGFLSNDKLTSYGTSPGQYGSRLPFARHGSTLAPTIAFKGNRPVFAVGAAGNAWITSGVYQTLLGALDYNLGPQAALELPRFLPGGGFGGGGGANAPYNIQIEDGFAPEVINRLRELGYDLSFVSARGELREGYGAAIRIDKSSVTAGADPRRAGAAGAVPK